MGKKGKSYRKVYETIVVKAHVIERLKERYPKEGITTKEAIRMITGHVQQSKLIKINNNEEHRLYSGYIYICKREHNNLVVVTVKLSYVRKKQHFADFTQEVPYESASLVS